MPFWRRYYRNRWRPRYRRFYWRRTRNPFQRRRRRRYRTYRVRRKKLKTIRLKQWQPPYVKRLKIHGYYPVIMGTRERVANNLNCYLESTAPHYVPGGGCFSINNFSFMSLYLEHFNLRNWWTVGNDNMPLIRYLGCTVNCYREENIDYLFYYNRQWPMTAKLITYQSTQPMAMLLNKHTVKIACKKNTRNKKPYKKIHIKPPAQMENKWYFQYDLATTPLLQTMTTACSFDRTFLNSKAVSSTIGFYTLDTNTFLNHQFQRTTSPYTPRPNTILFKVKNGQYDITKIQAQELIILGEVEDLNDGTEIGHLPDSDLLTPPTTLISSPTEFQKKFYTARMQHKWWGNVFKSSTFYGEERMIETNKNWDTIIKELTNPSSTLNTGYTWKTTKWAEVRYNPFSDKGKGNMAYLLKINSGLHSTEWGPPTDKDVITQDLPLHTLLWGFLDYQRKCAEYRDIDTTCILVIQCPYIIPKTFKFLVPLDKDFMEGTSPYRPQYEITPTDRQNWHPKVAFQVQTVNDICLCGPATVKLPEQTSCEAHISYNFYFKVGGQPAPMSNLTKPDEQPKYPIPNNLINTPSLQSPTIPFTQLLWNFDERRSELTKKATKRITDYQIPETSLISPTETSLSVPSEAFKAQETSETSSSEEEETPIQEQLNKQRRRQKLLRNRINILLKQLANM
nr:MAG: ORF1 [TTV-like mini virus]